MWPFVNELDINFYKTDIYAKFNFHSSKSVSCIVFGGNIMVRLSPSGQNTFKSQSGHSKCNDSHFGCIVCKQKLITVHNYLFVSRPLHYITKTMYNTMQKPKYVKSQQNVTLSQLPVTSTMSRQASS